MMPILLTDQNMLFQSSVAKFGKLYAIGQMFLVVYGQKLSK